jgi:hypothetical protein
VLFLTRYALGNTAHLSIDAPVGKVVGKTLAFVANALNLQ